jgi:glycine oxidase
VAELEFVEARAGLRPGTPDNKPLIGRAGVPGVIWATGHYRNGVLLAPITGDAVAELLTGGELPAELAPFGPERFGAGVA